MFPQAEKKVTILICCLTAAVLLSLSGCGSRPELPMEENSLQEYAERTVRIKYRDPGNADTALLYVEIPDYGVLFREAMETDDPDGYIKQALTHRNYSTVRRQIEARVTLEDGVRVIQKEEAIDQLMEQEMIQILQKLLQEEVQ